MRSTTEATRTDLLVVSGFALRWRGFRRDRGGRAGGVEDAYAPDAALTLKDKRVAVD